MISQLAEFLSERRSSITILYESDNRTKSSDLNGKIQITALRIFETLISYLARKYTIAAFFLNVL